MSPLVRLAVGGLSISGAALIGLAVSEGYRPTTYDDGVGVNTIGFGTTSGVKPGDRTDPVRALIRLGQDVSSMEKALAKCITVPLYQREWDAYVSWTYNVGVGAACSSTLLRKLNAGDYAGACKELSRWTYAGGRQLAGLVKRRDAERRQCLGEGS